MGASSHCLSGFKLGLALGFVPLRAEGISHDKFDRNMLTDDSLKGSQTFLMLTRLKMVNGDNWDKLLDRRLQN